MTEPEIDPAAVRANRLKLLLIVAIAVVPMLLAYVMYFYFTDLAPSSTTNKGHLITPPRQIQTIATTTGGQIPLGQWGMLIPAGSECDDGCQQLLYLSRQVHTALGKDSDRVKRFLLVAGDRINESFSRLVNDDHGDVEVRYYQAASLRSLFASVVDEPIRGNYLFLMDPNGNIMMYYDLELAGKPMLDDLKHLLKLSNLG